MSPTIATYEQAIEFLYGRINYEKAQAGSYTTQDFKLDRMAELLDRLGNPHLEIPAVHIAGTKGKGTTSMLLAGILEHAGYQTGLFTSPHISKFEERMRINGRTPEEPEFISLANQISKVAEAMDRLPGQMSPTFFELTMAMAWIWFRNRNANVVVLEVGLGGRLDATNLCRPVACGITSISRDHTGLLGSTLPEIAREKAGIIKPGVPAITGVEASEAREVIESICEDHKAPLWILGRDLLLGEVGTNADGFSVRTPSSHYENLSITLTGDHQKQNAALAIGLAEILKNGGWEISDSAIRDGLAKTVCPLRIEKVQQNPTLILDVAHNWASVSALLETLVRDYPLVNKRLIFAASRDKDVMGLLRLLIPHFQSIVVTQFLGNPRAVPVSQLREMVYRLSGQMPHTTDTPSQALKLAQKLAGPNDVICGTGSFFIAAELKEHCQEAMQKDASPSVVPSGA